MPRHLSNAERSAITRPAAIVLAVLVAFAPVAPKAAQTRIDWGNVANLQVGTSIVVFFNDPDRREREGRYNGHDGTGLSLRTGNVDQHIERREIRRIVKLRPAPKQKHVATGALIGAGVGVAAIAGQEDWSFLGRAMWAGIGGGIGALVGLATARNAAREVIYEASPP